MLYCVFRLSLIWTVRFKIEELFYKRFYELKKKPWYITDPTEILTHVFKPRTPIRNLWDLVSFTRGQHYDVDLFNTIGAFM